MKLSRVFLPIAIILLVACTDEVRAQEGTSPGKAFAKSLLVPGWGHYSVDSENWTRGQIHLGTEAALIASFFGFRGRASRIETQYETLARLEAGVNIEGRGRSFKIAVGDYNSLAEYNDYQLRSRRWNRLFETSAENDWKWSNENERHRYNELRSERDNIRNQLPAIISLMAANRIIAAFSAYNRARKAEGEMELALLPINTGTGETGFVASVVFRF